ncbi:Protein FAR1-RELATED SEQUENCE 5, partial [Ananas comosus]
MRPPLTAAHGRCEHPLGKWVVSKFHNVHNHELIMSPSKSRFVKEGEQQNIHFTLEEFENKWASLIEKYIFRKYVNLKCSESINAWLKLLLDSHTSIYKFIMQFEKITITCYEREDKENFKNKDGETHLWSYDPIERQARNIYTMAIFFEFRKYLRASTAYSILELEKNVLYKISPLTQSNIQKQRLRSYMVSVDVPNMKVSCNCKLFEFFEILYSYCLKVLPYINMHSIPPHYILKRWTKDAKKGTTQQKVGILANNETTYTKEKILEILRPRVEAILSEDTKVWRHLRLHIAKEKREDDDACDHNLAMISQSSQINQRVRGYALKNPPQSQCKGKRRPQRFRPYVEKKLRKVQIVIDGLTSLERETIQNRKKRKDDDACDHNLVVKGERLGVRRTSAHVRARGDGRRTYLRPWGGGCGAPASTTPRARRAATSLQRDRIHVT